MTTQFTNRISRFEPNGFGRRLNPFVQRGRPAILVGIQRDNCPPLAFGSHRLQRMQVIVIAPQQAAELIDPEVDDLEQDSLAEVLPLLPPGLGLTRPAQLRPRPILGEILRGENGAFYERFGNRIRPLRRLVSGVNGEVLEVADHGDAPPRLRARVATVVETEDEKEMDAGTAENETPPPSAPSSLNEERAGVRGESDRESTGASFRPLFPEPGQWRVVRLGDFEPMLVPQLVHPERLRDVHRLPCYVQVFEITAPQRIEKLAEGIFGDASAASQLRPLTPAIVQLLQLAPLLTAPTRLERPITRKPGLLLPHDRLIYLEVANDPTDGHTKEHEHSGSADHVSPSPGAAGEASAGESTITGRGEGGCPPNLVSKLEGQGEASYPRPSSRIVPTAPAASPASTIPEPSAEPAAQSSATPPPAAGPPALKTSIPAQFLKPWEFRFSREEALYEMSRAWSFMGRLRAGLRRLTGGLLFSSEFRKWQVLLTGKNLDEQLWSVRPPKGALSHPFIRDWARRTLELGGYDGAAMVAEWEIFWRRKEH